MAMEISMTRKRVHPWKFPWAIEISRSWKLGLGLPGLPFNGTPIGPLRHLVSLFPNTINICWAPEMSRAQFLPKRNFEAMGAQFISGVQLILMVLGAQNHEMY